MDKIFDILDDFLDWGGIKKNVVLLIISGIALLMSIFKIGDFPVDPAWVAIILCGIPLTLEALIGLIRDHDITADVLVAIALVASIIIGEDFAAGEVAFIMQIGECLEDITVARARAGIEKLVQMTPRTARLISRADGNVVDAGDAGVSAGASAEAGEAAGSTERMINAEEVLVGDVLRVLPGETIPVDGVITDGDTSIDQSVMTGESIPVDKTVGDSVSSGTVNQFGAFDMRAEKVGEDSSIQRMIKLVESADAGKAKIVGIADRWAVWIVLIAITSSIAAYFITHEIIRAVTVLVVFCPCALVLATPTAIMAGIGNATKHGFLVKEGDAMERLSQVDKVTFDKTGTLTYGKPEVAEVVLFGEGAEVMPSGEGAEVMPFGEGAEVMPSGEDNVYRLAASLESLSEHPLGKAIVRSFEKEGGELLPVDDFEMAPGKGVSGTVEGKHILAGNTDFLKESGIDIAADVTDKMKEEMDLGRTVIPVAEDGRVAGLIALSDTLRETASETVSGIKAAGAEPVLLTGDNEKSAMAIASEIGITDVKAGLLPEDKLGYIEGSEENGSKVCMVGDGINDAPALRRAHVGIAMGAAGSDIAVDAADIALVNDDIHGLPHLLKLSKHMMTVIKWNMVLSMGINFVAIVLAITGFLGPVVGALVHNGGSFFVISNSALLLNWKSK